MVLTTRATRHKSSETRAPGKGDPAIVDPRRRTVLVVGDWIVDENWTVAPERSITSTEPLGIHFRSIVGRQGSVHKLSGAGRVSHTLHHEISKLNQPSTEQIRMVGLGLWAENDTKYLEGLVASTANRYVNPYELSRAPYTAPDNSTDESNIALVNLAPYLKSQEKNEFGTAHAYQVFQRQPNGDLHLALRLDWEYPTARFSSAEGNHSWQLEPDTSHELRQELMKHGPKLEAIVVKCLGKGVLSTDLVKLLTEVFPEVPWFVSTKQGRRAIWLKSLNKKTLRLLFLSSDPLTHESIVQWRAENSRPSYEAVSYLEEVLDEYHGFLDPNEGAIVAMPSPLSLFALYADTNTPKPRCFRTSSVFPKGRKEVAKRLGNASVVFGNLVADILLTNNPFDSTLKLAAERTYEWRIGEEEQLAGEQQGPEPNVNPADQFNYETADPWEECMLQWKESRRGLGIVRAAGGQLCFDLWRGMSAVHRYVALTRTRRSAASRLYGIVKSFAQAQPPPEEASSCLLMDAPGRGKSALVKALAEPLDMEFRLIDLSQMNDRDDLLNRFDGIVTDQAESKRRFLVFVDEIDSDGGRWYSQFLAPLESGYYVRGGNRFHIEPCVWVFAGSTRRDAAADNAKGTKLPDLKSRLTHGEIQLSNSQKKNEESHGQAEERLERVYIAVSLLRQLFPNLKYVTPGVLFAFYSITTSIEIRGIRHLVHQVKRIEGNAIYARNLSFLTDNPDLGKRLPLKKAFRSEAGITDVDDDTLVLIRE